MSQRLISRFLPLSVKLSDPYYELFIEGDVNDGDYLQWTTILPSIKLEGSDFLLYLISFLYTHREHFEFHPDWKWFTAAGVASSCGAFDDIIVPMVEGRAVHSITNLELYRVQDGRYLQLQIPDWDSLFFDTTDKKKKMSAAFDEWRRSASAEWRLTHDKEA